VPPANRTKLRFIGLTATRRSPTRSRWKRPSISLARCITWESTLGDRVTTGPTGAFVPAYNNVETNNAASRQDPNRWHDRRDTVRGPAGDPPGDGAAQDRY